MVRRSASASASPLHGFHVRLGGRAGAPPVALAGGEELARGLRVALRWPRRVEPAPAVGGAAVLALRAVDAAAFEQAGGRRAGDAPGERVERRARQRDVDWARGALDGTYQLLRRQPRRRHPRHCHDGVACLHRGPHSGVRRAGIDRAHDERVAELEEV